MAHKPLRIAMYGHKRIPSREGGVEMVVEALSTRMAQKGHLVTCYNRKGRQIDHESGRTTPPKEYKGVKLRTVPTLDRKGLAAASAAFFAALATSFGRYDIVHIHAEGPAAFCWLPKLFGKRVIHTVHGLDWAREKWQGSFGAKFIQFGEKMAVKHANEIIVLSRNVQDYFQKTYGRKTIFISNGVQRPQYVAPQAIIETYGLHKGGYILFLGRLVPEKGLRYLIDAYKQIKTDKRLVIAGAASDTDAYVSEIKASAAQDDRILLTGFVQGQLLEELYSNAYIYTLPSDLEGMPLSLLEAMSYGNCCVVSDINECSEVVEDKAVLFRKGDVAHLKEQLERLCNHPNLVNEYKAKAADFICKKYNWDEVVQETLALYEKGSQLTC